MEKSDIQTSNGAGKVVEAVRADSLVEDDRIAGTGSEQLEESDRVSEPDEGKPAVPFRVVALGASAGGLEAFTRLLQHLPCNTGMAFVVIQHLAPQHASMLSSLLARTTSMPVVEVEDSLAVQPNHVFVIPPNKLMTISRGALELAPRLEARGVPMPIDHFFRSLAMDQKALAIGIVLSGTASDGALGLQAIRGEGGIAIAQSEDSAKFGGMPHDAVAAGAVDLVLPPEDIALELGRIARCPAPALETGPGGAEPAGENSLNRIFALMRAAVGVNFGVYKRGTLQRRIARRMLLKQKAGLAEYADFLASDPTEAAALSDDLLITVTSFFRDAAAFLALEEEILPRLLKDRPGDSPLRIWAPGCSTGEEIYSIAICVVEAMAKLRVAVPVQIFGTDLSSRAIALARQATYSESQLAPVSAERQQKFFVPHSPGYQVVKPVRELCVFARQNLCQDPPYSRIDLVTCRNVLIYFSPKMQRQVLSTFHYALQPDGFLMLGKSEGTRGAPDLFEPEGKQYKFFRRMAASAQPSLEFIGRKIVNERPEPTVNAKLESAQRSRELSIEKAAERIMLMEYGPPWVLVNDRLEIVHARGDTNAYLQLPAGAPSFDLLRMARPGLRADLRNLLARAKTDDGRPQSAVVTENIGSETLRTGLEVRRLTLSAMPGPCFLVVFLTLSRDANSGPGLPRPEAKDDSSAVAMLREELELTSQRLHSIIEEHDAANQELTSANEEIQSSNEELESINEELETSKEELQSSNEELNTVNEELQNRNRELARLGDDLTNLMSSTMIPILMLDNELRIRRLTPVAETILNIRPSDVGRPIGDIRMRLSVEDVEPVIRGVVETLHAREIEVQDREGRWHVLRVRPYRTADNRIEGAVLVLIDIDQLRRAQIEANAARAFAESVVESVQTPLLVLRGDLRVRVANRAFYRTYGMQPAEVETQLLFEMAGERWALPGLQSELEKIKPHRDDLQDTGFEGEFAALDGKILSIGAHAIQPYGEQMILVAIEDITARKNAEAILAKERGTLELTVQARSAELRKTSESLQTEASGRAHAESALHETEAALFRSRGELRQLTASLMNAQDAERRRVSRELHDDLSQKMAKLQFDIETLEQKLPADLVEAKQRLCKVRDEAGALSDDLRRVAHQLHPATLDSLGLTVALRAYAQEFSQSAGIAVSFASHDVPKDLPRETASCIYRITQEALRNVAKHAGKAAVEVSLNRTSAGLELLIRDNGVGFDAAVGRAKEGLGLIGMEERVRLAGGTFNLKSAPGHGVAITIHVPSREETI